MRRAGGWEARLEGLAGGTRVAEALRLAAEALGVAPGVEAALRLDTRELRGEETLAEAGVGAGCEVELWVAVGEAGGMPGGCFGLGGQRQLAVEELRASLREAEARVEAEARKRTEAEARVEAEARKRTEAEAQWKEDKRKLAETESLLKVEMSKSEASRSQPQPAVEELRARLREAEARVEAEARKRTEAEARVEAEAQRRSEGHRGGGASLSSTTVRGEVGFPSLFAVLWTALDCGSCGAGTRFLLTLCVVAVGRPPSWRKSFGPWMLRWAPAA